MINVCHGDIYLHTCVHVPPLLGVSWLYICFTLSLLTREQQENVRKGNRRLPLTQVNYGYKHEIPDVNAVHTAVNIWTHPDIYAQRQTQPIQGRATEAVTTLTLKIPPILWCHIYVSAPCASSRWAFMLRVLNSWLCVLFIFHDWSLN